MYKNTEIFRVHPSVLHTQKGLVAGCHSFCLYFIFYNLHTFIESHSCNTFIHRHLLRPLSISLSFVRSVGNTSLWCRPSRESKLRLPNSKPTRYQLSYAAPYWATPHHSSIHIFNYLSFKDRFATVVSFVQQLSLGWLIATAREYWIIYRETGFLSLVWFGSKPSPPPPPPPQSRQQVASLSQSFCVSLVVLLTGEGGGKGLGEELNHTIARKAGPLYLIQ